MEAARRRAFGTGDGQAWKMTSQHVYRSGTWNGLDRQVDPTRFHVTPLMIDTPISVRTFRTALAQWSGDTGSPATAEYWLYRARYSTIRPAVLSRVAFIGKQTRTSTTKSYATMEVTGRAIRIDPALAAYYIVAKCSSNMRFDCTEEISLQVRELVTDEMPDALTLAIGVDDAVPALRGHFTLYSDTGLALYELLV